MERKYEEKNEKEKTEYIIAILDLKNDIITKLRLSKVHRPLGFNLANRVETNYDIDYNGSEITITVTEFRMEWNGTGKETIGSVTIREGHVEEDPWFTDLEELSDMVEKIGVKETCKLILSSIKDVVDYFLAWEESV
jgi:hypothetical protein